MVLNPADVKAVFTNLGYRKSKKQTQQFSHMFGERTLGDSLFCIYDIEQHKKERQLYDEAFNNHFLQSIFPKFCERADAFMGRLKPWADGNTQVPMKKEIYRFSVDFVSQVIFSFDFDSEWKGRSLGMKYQKLSDYVTLWSTIVQGTAHSTMDPFFQTHIGEICHMPQYFEDPNVFKPSRFSPEMPRNSGVFPGERLVARMKNHTKPYPRTLSASLMDLEIG
eukprot:Em0005g1016a